MFLSAPAYAGVVDPLDQGWIDQARRRAQSHIERWNNSALPKDSLRQHAAVTRKRLRLGSCVLNSTHAVAFTLSLDDRNAGLALVVPRLGFAPLAPVLLADIVYPKHGPATRRLRTSYALIVNGNVVNGNVQQQHPLNRSDRSSYLPADRSRIEALGETAVLIGPGRGNWLTGFAVDTADQPIVLRRGETVTVLEPAPLSVPELILEPLLSGHIES